MDIITYCKNAGGRGTQACHVMAQIASRARCSVGTLYMIARGHKTAGPKIASAIEYATDGAVTRYDLRPDIFGHTPSPMDARDAGGSA